MKNEIFSLCLGTGTGEEVLVEVPLLTFPIIDSTTSDDVADTASFTGFEVFTLVDNNDGSSILLKGFHFANRLQFVLFDLKTYSLFKDEEYINIFFESKNEEDLNLEHDYQIDPNQLTLEEIEAKKIRGDILN